MRSHGNTGIEKRLLISLGLTLLIFLVQLIGSIWTGSLALLSDSAHVFMDAFSLGLSYLALRLSALPSDDKHTYGYHRLEVFAALINGGSLLFISLGIFWEAYQRWFEPVSVRSVEMLVVAVIGLVANLLVTWILGGHNDEHGHSHVHNDLNLRSAFLHVLGDAVSSVGVILAAIIIWMTGWLWMDPLVSVLIGGMILFGAYRVLRPSLHILIEGTPEGLSLGEVRRSMQGTGHVQDLHDLHVWNICSGHVALSAHVVLSSEGMDNSTGVMNELKQRLHDSFGIEHTTIQFERVACPEEYHVCK